MFVHIFVSLKNKSLVKHCAQVYVQHLILTVDDDPVNQMVFSNVLQPLGYKLVQAMDGMEAMAILEELDTFPDIILLARAPQ